MKHLSLLLVFFSSVCYSQSLTLKHNGFVSGIDSTKSYAVIETPNIKQAELYKKTLTYVNSLYSTPSKVISSVENESITINAYTEAVKGSLSWYRYPMNYNIVIQFKDGKIRFEPKIISLDEIWAENKPARKIYIVSSQSPNPAEINCIYMSSKEGGYFLFKDDIKKSIDAWVNGYMNGISKNLNDNW